MEISETTLLSADADAAGQPIVFPRGDGHVTAAIYEVAPGATLPVHKHPSPRMGYILEGRLRVTSAETGLSEIHEPGTFVLESVDRWHGGDNPGTVPVRLLVIDLTTKGAQTTIFKD